MVYPVISSGGQTTMAAVERWICRFAITLFIIHDRGTAFLNTDFVNWTKKIGITFQPQTDCSPWTNDKEETQNEHIASCRLSFLNGAGTNWASLAPKVASVHNTSVKYTTSKTPYETVCDARLQFPMSVYLGFYRNIHKFAI